MSPESSIAHYRITSKLGEGGMGAVYRATDTKLNRDVAIKVLPAHLADDPQFRERFDREAKSIAALNHPNICALHDIGDSDLTGGGPGTAGAGRVQFLVLEYLEGETLAARLGRGALTVREALAVAIQMADALDKAHRAGIVHRDLKPGNVFLVRSGGASAPLTAKLLDFGLAKVAGAAPSVGAAAVTMSAVPAPAPLTAQGTILGTFQYMSPEQIEGRDADARSDIFAFGALLYEMVTGARAFTGRTTASVMAAILGAEPPALSSLQPLTPAALERVVRRCLEKDADDRWQTARDLLAELKWIADSSATTSDTARAAQAASGRERLGWAAAALVAAAAAGGGVWLLTRPSPSVPTLVARFTIALPASTALTGFTSNVIALSRDGTSIVYVGQVAGARSQLYLRPLDQLEPTPVRGTEGALGPFFSPDGTAIGFEAGRQIRKVPVSGGGPLTLVDAVGVAVAGGGAVWSTDDGIYFASREAQQGTWLHRIPSGGGPVVDITVSGLPTDSLVRQPDLLPGGKAALVTLVRPGTVDASAIAVVMLETGEQRTIIEGGGLSPRYVSSGHIVFGRAGALLAVPFDLKRLEVTGVATPVVESVQTQSGVAQFAISTTGTLVYAPGRSTAALSSLVWVDRRGNETPIPGRPGEYQELDLAPDGLRVAANEGFNAFSGGGSIGGDVWIHQVARGTATRFTFGPQANETPVWSRDGREIAYASRQAGNTVFVKPSDGSAPEKKVGEKADGHLHLESWSPRGDVMALVDTSGAGGHDIWLLRLADQKFEAFLKTPASERSPAFSPDGRWIAYVTNESGHDEVYVQAFPGPGGRWQVSVDGGVEPMWAPNGRELFYRNGEKLMAVPIESTATSIGAGTPALLFEKRYVLSGEGRYYDVAPDGQRFVMLKPVATAGDSLIVVQGFTRELERLVPTKK